MLAPDIDADISLHFACALLPDGWAENVRIDVKGGRIAAITADATPAATDERHGAALPGIPNLHSHAFQRGMAGLAERRGPSGDSFWTWREVMYRFLDRMTPDDVNAIAAWAYIEMLETGFTRVGEFHYLHHDIGGRAFSDPAEMSQAIVAAAASSGIGLTLLPVLYSYAGFGAKPPEAHQRRFIHDIDGYARLVEACDRMRSALPDMVVGIAPHSLRAVSPDELDALAPITADRPIHIHIAEQMREVEDCLAWSGQRPVEWLLDHAEVGPAWCLVHATHVNADETIRLAQSGAVAGLCPITEANLGDGIFPADRFAASDGRYGIGSDSNVMIDCTEELRLLEYGQRLANRGRNILARGEGRSTGTDIYVTALAGGSAALEANAGFLVGAPADIVSLDLSHPSLAGKRPEILCDALIFSAGRRAIDCVWRFGEKLVTGGIHRDRGRAAARYISVIEGLIA